LRPENGEITMAKSRTKPDMADNSFDINLKLILLNELKNFLKREEKKS
jgi:hypothetical protein